MKLFFSIELIHEYDEGFAEQLSVMPAGSNSDFIRNNRLLFRKKTGSIECYIEDDKAIKNEVKSLGFWVICINESFYNYTDYLNTINFYKPYYYWTFNEDFSLKTSTMETQLEAEKIKGVSTLENELLQAPNNAIGFISIKINKIEDVEIFKIQFSTKKTIWEYNINAIPEQKDWNYKIIDEEGEWQFIEIDTEEDIIKFQSKNTIPFSKKASKRLMLLWETNEASRLEEAQSMILPFANYKYKMVTENNKELTPIYIYI